MSITPLTNRDSGADSMTKINANFTTLSTTVTATQRTATVIVGTAAGADYVCTGTNDGAVIQAAITAAAGGKVIFRNGTYNWNASSDRCIVATSNTTLEGETFGGVIFKAVSSLFAGGANRQGSYGILTIGKTNTSKISNITVRNIVFDLNNVDKTAALTIQGGNVSAAIGVQNVIIENVLVKNSQTGASDGVEAGTFLIAGHTNFGDYGYIDNLLFRDCEFSYGNQLGIFILGTNITKLEFNRCYIHECQASGVGINDYGTTTTHSDWSLLQCRFDRNMITAQAYSQAHFRDGTQVGMYNFRVESCYFGPAVNSGTAQDYALTPYQASDCYIIDNFFDRGGGGISIGASQAASYSASFPIRRIFIEGNIFNQMRSCFDPDASVHMFLKNNIFYEIKYGPVISPYSEHFPTVIEGNLIYNCNNATVQRDGNEDRCAFRLNGDGFVVKNNYIIDDRLLVDPTLNFGGLISVTSGALAARTYYFRYTFSNDIGETLPSTEQSLAIAVNKLAYVTLPTTLPTGAKYVKIYISTSAGTETLQYSAPIPSGTYQWTEPITGLVAGAALPVANTTGNGCLYGIYELAGGGSTYANIYQDNYFFGIQTPIRKDTQYRRIVSGNFSDLTGVTGGTSSVEKAPYAQGNVTGATTFNIFNGETITATLTGNITATLSSGEYKGQTLTLILTQGGVGSFTYTKTATTKLAGGAITLSTAVGAVDTISFYWNGTNWYETSRTLNNS